MANEAKSRGSNIVDQLYDKLQNTQFYGAASGVVKDYLAKARSKAESRYKLAKEKFNDISDKANSVMDQASIFNYESDRYKKSKEGKSELRDIKNEAISLNEDLKGVEKYV